MKILMFYYKDFLIYKFTKRFSQEYTSETNWREKVQDFVDPSLCACAKIYENKDALRCMKYRNADHDI